MGRVGVHRAGQIVRGTWHERLEVANHSFIRYLVAGIGMVAARVRSRIRHSAHVPVHGIESWIVGKRIKRQEINLPSRTGGARVLLVGDHLWTMFLRARSSGRVYGSIARARISRENRDIVLLSASETVGRLLLRSLLRIRGRRSTRRSVVSQTRRILNRFDGTAVRIIPPVLVVVGVGTARMSSTRDQTGDAVFLTVPARNVTKTEFVQHNGVRWHFMLVKTACNHVIISGLFLHDWGYLPCCW